MGSEGFKKELGPGLQTAAGAAMMATGNPAGAMLLGSGIAGMAGGLMPGEKKPPMPGGQAPMGAPGGQAPMGAAPAPTPTSASPGGLPPGGGPMPVAPPQDPRMQGKAPMDPALRRFITGQ